MSLYLFSWDFPETRTLKSFILFLFCSLAIWVGNALIMISSTSSQLIEQPMHFFLNYLSLCDLSYTSIVIPKLITDLLAERKTISCRHYMAQLFTMHFFGGIEIFILTGMAYDRSMAIWSHCTTPSSWAGRGVMPSLPAVLGAFIHSASQFLLTIFLPFCGPNEIDHYFCDVYPLLKLACSNTRMIGFLVTANSGLVVLVTFAVLMLPYLFILFVIRAYSVESCSKALSIRSSHITVVVLFFAPESFFYIRPATTFLEDKTQRWRMPSGKFGVVMYFWKESNFSEAFLHFMRRFRETTIGNNIHFHHLCLKR